MRSWNEAPAARTRRNGQLCGVCGCRKRARRQRWCAGSGRARRWAGERTCVSLSTVQHIAVVSVALRSTTCHSCNTFVGLRQRRRLAVHLLLERLRVFRRDLGFYILQNRENVKTKVPSSNSKALEQEVFRKWI